MFDIGWSEIAIITTVAIIIIGPKDLPKVLRTVGQWIGKAKAMAREFQSSIDDVIKETELDEVTKQINQASHLDINEKITKAIDKDGELEDAFKVEMPEEKQVEELEEASEDELSDPMYDGDQDEDEKNEQDDSGLDEALVAAEKVNISAPSKDG